jgi:hypothetical protein
MIFKNSAELEIITCKLVCGDELGTAFFVAEGLLLTADHCLAEYHVGRKEIIVDYGGETYVANFINSDPKLDVALIKIEFKQPVNILPLVKSPVFVGESWFTFGFPNTSTGRFAGDTETGVIKRAIIGNSITIIDMDLTCTGFHPNFMYKGYSGSPIINQEGAIVGVMLKMLNKGLGAVSVHKIYSFLELNGIPFDTDYKKYDSRQFGANWFKSYADKIILDAGPRYSQEVNIDLGIATVLNAVSADDSFFDNLGKTLGEIKDHMGSLGPQTVNATLYQEHFSTVTSIIDSFILVRKNRSKKFDLPAWPNTLWAINEKLDEALSNLRSAGSTTGQGAKSNDNEIYHLSRVISALYKLANFLSGKDASSFNSRCLLLTGNAGQGKTHLLADITLKKIEHGIPSFLFFGHHFYDGDPWKQMIDRLEISMTKSEFLSAINNLGEIRQTRILIAIDALNEGIGKLYWPDRIHGVLNEIISYPWLSVVISIRTPFDEVIVPSSMLQSGPLVKVEHPGFRGFEFEAVRKYFEYYKLEMHSMPLLEPEFSNPLFLKIFCQGLVGKNHIRLPRGWHKFTVVFNVYLDYKNQIIAKAIDVDPKQNPLNRVLSEFSAFLLSHEKSYLTRREAHEICEQIYPSFGWSRSILNHMIGEGLLLESIIRNNSAEWLDTIEFAYERFSDFLKANWLADLFEDFPTNIGKKPLNQVFSEHGLYINSNLIDALCILIPERYGKELYEFFPELSISDRMVYGFLNSLVWRSYTSINYDKTLSYFNLVMEGNGFYYRQLLNVFLLVASDPDHPFNGNYLHEYLLAFETIAERDKHWSIPVFNFYSKNSDEYGSSSKTVVDSYIRWAWSDEPKTHISDDALLLTAMTISWFLTSSNRPLRDDSTKALIMLLRDRPETLIALLEKFVNVNDPYVSERLFAVCYGVILETNDVVVTEKIALNIYQRIFADGNPPVHLLLRDYARNVVERALFLNPDLPVDMSLVRPPYYSSWIDAPDHDEVIIHEVDKLAKTPYSREDIAKSRLYDSVMGFGDFARYIIGTNSHSEWTNLRMRGENYVKQLKKAVDRSTKTKLNKLADVIGAITITKPLIGRVTQAENILESLNEVYDNLVNDLSAIMKKENFDIVVNEFIPYYVYLSSRPKNKVGKKIEKFDLSILQRLIIQKVYQLGWNKEEFGLFDAGTAYSDRGRDAGKSERLGKKYQWLGYHEYLARIADNYYYSGSGYYSGIQNYEGPFQGSRERDIDPSITIRKAINEPSETFKYVFDPDEYEIPPEKDHSTWLKDKNDLPDPRTLIQYIDNNGEEWLMLEGYFEWKENLPVDDPGFSEPQKRLWYQIRSYLVKRKDKDLFYNWAGKQDFMGRWMPESHDNYEYYLKESYWAPAYVLSKKENQNRVWINPGRQGKNGTVKCSVVVTAESHLCEIGNYDCSIDETINTMIPAQYIAEKMGLKFARKTGYLENSAGELVCFDPSLFDGGTHSLIMNKKKFQNFLDEYDLDIVWTLLGEKMIIGGRSSEYIGRMEISGTFHLNKNSQIDGNVNSTSK